MLIRTKIEKIILIIILLMLFLVIKKYLSSLFYAVNILMVSLYFFPIKIIMCKDKPNYKLLISSSFLISVILIMSYLSIIMGELVNSFKIILFFLCILNIFFIYKYVEMKDDNKNIHLIMLLLLIISYYK